MSTKRLLFIIILLFFTSTGIQAGATSINFSDVKKQHPNVTEKQFNLNKWMLHYYINPSPNDIAKKLKEFSEHGLFNDEKKLYPFLGFASTLFRLNAEKTRLWVSVSDNFPDNDQKIILLSLWLSGTKESIEILRKPKYKKIIARGNYYQFNTDKAPPTLISMSQFRPGYLDMNWGSFYATGNHEPIIRILNFLEFGDYLGSMEKYGKPRNKKENDEMYMELLYDTAVWSIKSNCKSLPGFKEVLSQIYQQNNLSGKSHRRLGLLLTVVYPEKYKLKN